MVDFIDSGGEHFTINVLDARNIIHRVWQKVSKEIILNCFTHGGFLEIEDHFDPDDDLSLADEENSAGRRSSRPIFLIVKMQFVHIDDQVVTVEYLDDDAIVVAMSSAVDTGDDEEKENKDEESVGMELIPTPTTSEALRHIDSDRHFLPS
ncbi:unnamed protein product [Acanthoscelides obtectus]|uniref:Uncharacterized protein n=1 Tax=Acanthoscelides obtectus TaxID=200917 RepID=A0A9P0LST2_ACAOB|nr:unnamed protein product [Acanthoscelides obtectus]CAK1675539.1 Tigger transposable element-derived protein 4 [Acanthoscelides obtectus]